MVNKKENKTDNIDYYILVANLDTSGFTIKVAFNVRFYHKFMESGERL